MSERDIRALSKTELIDLCLYLQRDVDIKDWRLHKTRTDRRAKQVNRMEQIIKYAGVVVLTLLAAFALSMMFHWASFGY